MAFLFMQPKSRMPVNKSEKERRIPKKLDAYIKENSEALERRLARFWEDQAAVAAYGERLAIVENEEVPEELLQVWSEDYLHLVKEEMAPAWEKAMREGSCALEELEDLGVALDTSQPYVMRWIERNKTELVMDFCKGQQEALRYLVMEGVACRMSIEECARYIRPAIGLTQQQASANLRYYANMKEQLQKDYPRMTAEEAERRARQAAAKYAKRQHRYRAETIAQTELARAYNFGTDAMVRQAVSEGLMPPMRKIWSASASNACTVCRMMDGHPAVEMNQEFSVKYGKRVKREQRVLLPPAHPRCRCAVYYVEKTGDSAIIEEQGNVVWDAIHSGAVSLEINRNKEERHIKGAKGYIEGRSYFYGDFADVKQLVGASYGTGEPIINDNGIWNRKERVRFDHVIGVCIDQKTGNEMETCEALIHYSKTGVHIIPAKG